MSGMYDALIIGAGMSGLAAGIRLAMYDKKVLILESHVIPGGLNSYYTRAGREFDVGLHALTNFAKKAERGAPLTKLLKQLRLPYEALELREQSHSKIVFPNHTLHFTNDFERLTSEIATQFPNEVDGFLALSQKVREFNDVALENTYLPAREVLKSFIGDPTLLEMILCPLLIYGSAWEDDMDFSQFVIMFKALYFEGLARPSGGVRTIIDLLTKRYQELGGEIRYRARVERIHAQNGEVHGVTLKGGEQIEARRVLSSAGHPETMNLLGEQHAGLPRSGNLSFCESIFILDKTPQELGEDSTLIFYNNRDTYHYRRPESYYDSHSAVICLPNNYHDSGLDEGWARATFIANFTLWDELKKADKIQYREKKGEVAASALGLMNQFMPGISKSTQVTDVFSPTTVTRYTSHFKGAVYGSPDKLRDGRTPIKGLALCGTDQGFLGIIGSMLSGISMANLHVLMD